MSVFRPVTNLLGLKEKKQKRQLSLQVPQSRSSNDFEAIENL